MQDRQKYYKESYRGKISTGLPQWSKIGIIRKNWESRGIKKISLCQRKIGEELISVFVILDDGALWTNTFEQTTYFS